MDYPSSSQRERWIYTIESLVAARQETRDSFISEAQASGRDVTSASAHMISIAEEAGLLRHYQEKLLTACINLRLPRKVVCTSISFLKRFYIKRSSLEYDPQHMALVCLYVACKVEDCYISAAELGRLIGVPAELLLKMELVLLQGLGFDLQVHSLYRAVDGVLTDLGVWAATTTGKQHGLDNNALKEIKTVSYSAADALLLSDAPLVFSPGQTGLAAVYMGLSKHGSDAATEYIVHVAGREGASTSADQLMGMLRAADSVEAASGSVSTKNVVSIDRQLKSFRRALVQGAGAK